MEDSHGPTPAERFKELLGSSRRARLVTLGTTTALVIAVIAFVVLPADEEDPRPQDAYTLAADLTCVAEKKRIAATGQRALQKQGRAELIAYAEGLVPIAVEWRASLWESPPPADSAALVEELSLALREVAVEAGSLARVAGEGDPDRIVSLAKEVDAATARVEAAIDDLGLERCAALRIALVRGDSE